MKRIIILFIVFGCVLFPEAQVLENLGKYQFCTNCPGNTSDPTETYSYGKSTPMEVGDIGDNYDRRLPSKGSLWHLGWDLNFGSLANTDEGAIVLSPFTDDVEILDIYNATPKNTSLTVITIGKQNQYAYYYMHGFVDDKDATTDGNTACRSGKLVLFQPKINNFKEAFCIINTQDNEAWCEKSYTESTVTFGSKSYNVSTKLKHGDAIFPIGGSGKYPIHLHVGAVKNGKIDAGQYWNNAAIAPLISKISLDQNLKGLGKTTQKNPNINIYNYLGNPWVSIRYPGYKPTSIKARINIDNVNNSNHPYNKVAMVDQIQYLVTPKSEPMVNKVIVGKSLQGEISIGSNKTRYPESIKDNIGSHYSGNNDGVTGMESFAYNNSTGAHPWDDYYFSDFAPRKYKNFGSTDIADFSNDAQYPDGEYNLAVRLIKKN